jgi:hypothetical protein
MYHSTKYYLSRRFKMGKIGDIATLGVIAVVGYFALKNWDAIKDFFGDIGGIFDRGEQPEGTPWFVPPATQPYIPPTGVIIPDLPEQMPIPPPTIPELIFPPLALLLVIHQPYLLFINLTLT